MKIGSGAWENCYIGPVALLELVKAWLEHHGAYQNPETLHKPFVFPSVCLGLAWVFDGTSMGCWWQLLLASACGSGSHRTSREVSHRRWHRRARSRGGAHVMASWRRASHMLRTDTWKGMEGLWVWPKGSQDVSLHLELGQSMTKSQQFHKKNSKKYVGRGLGLALRPCLEKNGRVKVCLES